MSTPAIVIAACCVITAAIKAVGPVALGGRDLPTWFTSVVILLSPALLAALVATQAFANGDHLAHRRGHGGRGRRRPRHLAHRLDHRLRGARGGGHRRRARALGPG